MQQLIGPFSQVLTMDQLPAKGPIFDHKMQVIEDGWILTCDGTISAVGNADDFRGMNVPRVIVDVPSVCIPGLIDCHTHICWGGNRSHEYAMKLQGIPYQEIAANGGGILSTVSATRGSTEDELYHLMLERAEKLLSRGVTTCEVKSGYGLSVDAEMKMLSVIQKCGQIHPISFVSTCLGAHVRPKEWEENTKYLNYLLEELLPRAKNELNVNRVDIFVEKGAFSALEAKSYLLNAKKMGFDLVIHGDQFSSAGSRLAVEVGALSVDHLEHISEEDADLLAQSSVIPVVLPGASCGLGIPFAPARMLLDKNLPVAIASDWNPGSAPMGDLLTQSSLLGIYEKMTMAEIFAGITFRAASALKMKDRGILKPNMVADFIVYPTSNYQDILYFQGAMRPSHVFKGGNLVFSSHPITSEVLC